MANIGSTPSYYGEDIDPYRYRSKEEYIMAKYREMQNRCERAEKKLADAEKPSQQPTEQKKPKHLNPKLLLTKG